MFRLRRVFTVIVALILLTIPVAQSFAQSPKMYWTEAGNGKIQRANQDGSSVETLLTAGSTVAIALDTTSGKIYWSDQVTGKIQQSNLDGTGVEDILTGLNNPLGIALDLAGGKMYFVVESDSTIQRANLDGTSVETLVAGLGDPRNLALDVNGGKMYWTDAGTDSIQRANLDGTNVEDLVYDLNAPFGIALDVAAGKMYWTDPSLDKIQRANLDGTAVEDVVTAGLSGPVGLALDLSNGRMYWTDSGSGSIKRANLDGTNIETLVTGLAVPHGIALDLTVTTVSFSAFNPKIELELGTGAADDEFEIKAGLTLGTNSNGINPLAEDVLIQVGDFSTTIPAGSFHLDKKGRFKFEGVINGVSLEVVFRPLGGNRYEVRAEGENVSLAGVTNPVTISLTINDDAGSATVTAEFE